MTAKRSIYITTPIYYVNDTPHIGHAYTTLACDALARFHRLDGHDVLFLTGTDEHGQKVEKSAAKAGLAPLAFCDKVSANFRELSRAMKFSNDDFIRTTEERHVRSVSALWTKLVDNGAIYLGSYAGWYAVRDEAFYAEDETTVNEAGQRVGPTGAPVEWVEEPSYFFKLSAFQDRLLELYAKRPEFVRPETRYNEVVSFVKSGLRDLSVSRTSFTWGIPVPGDPKHIMYVWLDALTNYISALGYPDTHNERFRRFWPATVQMMGKDILRFHAVYWPAFLMAADIEVPRQIFAHGWWTREGQKISKSLGNVIDPFELVTKYGLDAVRYFLLREVPLGQDGDFSHQAMVLRMNADLANAFGNLAQRTLSLIQKNAGGAVPSPGALTAEDETLLASAHALLPAMRASIEACAPHAALSQFMTLVYDANKYVDVQAPWALAKSDPPRGLTVLYVLAEVVRHLAILAQPFMPDAGAKLLDQLAIPTSERDFEHLTPEHAVRPGTALGKPEGVFPRYVDPAAPPRK
jgi:methionyl-tRNA synthetase